MSIVIDIIIIGIILACIFFGYKRGLIGVAFKILSFIIALVISLILFKPISNYIIKNTQIDDNIKDYIVQVIEGKEDTASEEKKEKSENTPAVIMDYINTSIEQATKEAKSNVAEVVSENITVTIINAAIILLLFIILRIILIFVKILSDAIAELPIIKQFNATGGIIYGILQGFLIVFVVLGVISMFIPVPALQNAINDSFVGSFLYNNNLLLKIFF